MSAADDREPIVGLGMPVFNGQQFVAEAISSILRQSLQDWELVICDNASTDRTREICEGFAASDRRIRYFRNERNLGAHPNYNLTFQRSQGRYFKWVPHDDVLHEDYLAACVSCLDGNPDAVLCQSDFEYIDEKSARLAIHDERLAGSDSSVCKERFGAVILLPHTCYDVMGVFRRDVLAESILLPSFHGADRALLADLSIRGSFAHVPRPLLKVRDHPGRYSRAKTRPADRARWHDARNSSRFSFPTWTLYRTYWRLVRGARISGPDKARLMLQLGKWWTVNWNAARAAVDVVASVAPGAVDAAQRVKQHLFSPAPGVDSADRDRSG